jgi:PAS domain S-box-containing protein
LHEKGISLDIDKPEWLGQMEGILETLNEGVVIADDFDRVLFVNSVFEEMTGWPRQAFIGHEAVREYYSPEDYAVLQERHNETRQMGRSRQEFFLPRKDGGRLPVVISARVFKSSDGHQFAILTFTDISEQKNAEAQLRAANKLLEKRQKEIDEDLVLAARVQQSLSPKSMIWAGMRVETYYHPARTIGGDLGLVRPQGDDYLNLLVCDVSGHGIGSALVANRIYTETVAKLRSAAPLAEVLEYLNRFLMQEISGGTTLYLTMAAARVERSGRRMTFAGAGHPPAMVVQPGAEPRLLGSNSTVLGALPEAVGPEAAIEVDLAPGDRIFLYTDGITEVFDARGEMLGVAGVRNFVREDSRLPLREMKQSILDKVAAWRDGPATDDVSLVLAEVV